MPKVTFQGKTINCEFGANLRRVLIANQLNLLIVLVLVVVGLVR